MLGVFSFSCLLESSRQLDTSREFKQEDQSDRYKFESRPPPSLRWYGKPSRISITVQKVEFFIMAQRTELERTELRTVVGTIKRTRVIVSYGRYRSCIWLLSYGCLIISNSHP